MTRLLVDPATDFDDPNPVTLTATLLDPGPALVRTFEGVTAATVVDLAAPDTAQAWRLTVRRPVTTLNRWNIASTNPGPILEERTVHFTDLPTVPWADLTDVDPATLRTTAVPGAAWDAAIAELRAEVDNLPTGGGGGGFSGAYADLTGKPAIPASPADIGAEAAGTADAAIQALGLGTAATRAATDFDQAGASSNAVDPVARGDLAVMAGQLTPHFVQATLGVGDGQAHWSPGNGGMYVAPLDLDSSSDGSAWDGSGHAWTIPKSGLYQLTAAVRLTDSYPAGSNIGMGVDFTSTGGPNFVWHGVTGASRHTFQLSRVAHFDEGQSVYLYLYVDGGPGAFSTAALGIALIAAD